MFPRNRHSAFRALIGPPECTARVHLARIVSAALVLAALAYPAHAQEEKGWSWGPEMRLNLVDANPWVIAIHPDSGWQITALLQAKNNRLLGIGVPWYPPLFPHNNTTGYLVFDDPDGCPSLIAPIGQISTYKDFYCLGTPDPDLPECTPPDWGPVLLTELGDDCPSFIPASLVETLRWEKDETWVEFTPGLSFKQPVGTGTGSEEEEEPVLWKWGSICDDAEPTPNCVSGFVRGPYGPDLGTVGDDVRYGSWRRMPGLVVLADHGPGVKFIEPDEGDTVPAPDFFDLIEPREGRNLAGFFQSATYSLKGGIGETSLMAHLNVPYELFSPVVLFDNNISIPTLDDSDVLCGENDALYRMDGGPLTCFVGGGLASLDSVVNNTVVTLRVFMLDGVAPDILEDRDGNGRIDIHDAELMGFHPVSPQVTTRFKQYHEYFCGYPYDFDGNGIGGSCVAGARPGGLTQPPR
jgi:hypothetical protein